MSDSVERDGLQTIQDLKYYNKSIVHNLPNYVYILDQNCSIVDCNKNLLSFLRIDKIEDLSDSFYAHLIKHNHFSEQRIAKMKKDDIHALLDKESQLDCQEPPMVHEDGTILYFKTNRVPLFNSSQDIVGLLVVLVDITEQLKKDEELTQVKERLQKLATVVPEKPITQPIHRDPKDPPKVLMIEDNAVAQKAVQALLMQLDCRVDVAESGEKATSLFKPGKYDLVFMDIGLEDGSGYIVSKKFRQMEAGTNYRVPIIALTGYEADVVKLDCNDYFMEGAITKPLTSEQARQIIEHYIYHMDIPVFGLKSAKITPGSNTESM